MNSKPIPKRIRAFLLCFALLVGLLPTTALAAGEEEPSVTLIITSSGGSAVYGTTVSMVATVTNLTSSSQVFVQLFKGTDAQYFVQQPATPMPGTGMLSVTYEVSLTGDTWKPGDYSITAKVTINGTTYSSEAVDLKVTKATQSLSTPTANSKTSTSVTLNAVTGGKTDVKYACVEGESATAPADENNWQTDTTFNNLQPATAYTFFAHCAGNDYYNEATTSAVIYTNYAVTTDIDFVSGSEPGTALGSWDKVEGATSYIVKLYKQGNEQPLTEKEVSANHDLNKQNCIFDIASAGTYSFTVKATNEGIDGDVATSKSLTFYEVKFDSMGGSTVSPVYAVKDSNLSKPANPEKENFTFGGWYQDSNCTNPWYFTDVNNPSAVPEGGVTLYAKWLSTDAGVRSVTMNGQSATVSEEENTFNVSLPYGTAITDDTISINPADEKATVSNLQADENDNSKWTFTVTAEDGTTAENYTINVTFSPVASSLTVEPTENTLTYGDELEIKVTPGIAAANALTTEENTVELYNGDKLLTSSAEADANGTYTLTYNTQQKGLTIGSNTLTVSYGGSGNLNPSTATVNVTLSKKDVTPELDGTFSKTYDGTTNAPEGLTIKLNGVLNNDKVTATGTVAYNTDDVGTGKTITANNIELTGDDAVYYILTHQTATNNGGEITAAALSGTLTITGTAQYDQTLTANYTPVHDEQVSYQWNRNGQPITGATGDTYTLTAEDVEQSITVTATATDRNHTGSVISEPVTVEKPYTPPANPNYRIDVTTTEGGTVDKDPAAAKAGETVTLTPTPEEGYEVGEVTVTDRFGDAVEVTENADGTYTFTMPSGQVRVEVTFVEVQPEPLPFTDVNETDWFHDAVQYAYDNGLMDGVGDNQFAPNATTNRAMVVTILYRLAGEPDVSGDSAFADVAAGQWYSNAVAWAAANGIVNGISETQFSPSGDLTREQLATILYRYAQDQGYDVSASADLSGFPDAGDIQDYATQALSWAVAEGLLQGFEDDSLRPGGTATRAQIATILMRFCEGVGA